MQLPDTEPNEPSRPLVSVRTFTYNHAPYIEACILGVLKQKTNFKFEYIIGEDCSTDGTREIVFKYAREYPEIIKVVTSDQNVGGAKNVERCREASRGVYIAICEGDDVWTDPDKLQMQVDILEENKEVAGCFHAVEIDYMGRNKKRLVRYEKEGVLGFEDYHRKRVFIATASVMFRSAVVEHLYKEDWVNNLFAGDSLTKNFLLVSGGMYYIDRPMCVFRKGVPGSWSREKITPEKTDREFLDNMKIFMAVNKISHYKYQKTINQCCKNLLGKYIIRTLLNSSKGGRLGQVFRNLFLFDIDNIKLFVKSFLRKK